MLRDELTKNGVFLRLMEFATTGQGRVDASLDQAVRARQQAVASSYTEPDPEHRAWSPTCPVMPGVS